MTEINLGTEVSSVDVEYDNRTIGTIVSGETLGKIKTLMKAAAPGLKNARLTLDNDETTELDATDFRLSLDEAFDEYGTFTKVSVTGSVSPSAA